MNENLKRKNMFIFIVLILCVINIVFLDIGYAQTSDSEDIEPTFCLLESEYKEWEKLSEEEKNKTPIPVICEDDEEYSWSNFHVDFFTLTNVKGELPSKYDAREEGYASVVKHQQQTGSCWAQAATTSLELYSRKKLGLNYIFSPRHMEYASTRTFLNNQINENGYNRAAGDGGNHTVSSNYFMNGYGPISEEEMPFKNNEDLIDISEIQNKKQLLDVNNVILYTGVAGTKCSTTDITTIKNYISEYGSVAANIYIETSSGNYYDQETFGYCYIGSNTPNHTVTIVGWDDNYASTNFSVYNRPLSNGAWIVQNSYGEGFGEQGYFYISYSDVNVCTDYMVIAEADNTIEDNIYSHDKLGFNSSLGYSKKTAYGMNVFTKEKGNEEILKEVTIGSRGKGNYTIYYMEGHGGKTKISEMTKIGSGRLEYLGYVTHKLDEEIILGEDVTDFSIAVYYEMDTLKNVLPLSSKTSSVYEYITFEEGKSYSSSSGTSWTDLSGTANQAIFSLKASTTSATSSSEYTIDKENLLIYVPEETTIETFKSNMSGSNNDVYKEDTIITEGNIATGMKYKNYSIVVKGDVTGDGKVKMNDVMKISKYIIDDSGIEGNEYLQAADVNMDSNIKMNDVMKISKYIVEGGTL